MISKTQYAKMKQNHIKKFFWRYLFISIALTALSTCQKAPINGDLDGQWQVMSVEPEPDRQPFDVNIYYCFYLHTCHLTSYGEGVWTTGNFSFDGESLSLDFPYLDMEKPLVSEKLSQFGISSNPVTFDVAHLDNKKMILKNGNTTVTLRKF